MTRIFNLLSFFILLLNAAVLAAPTTSHSRRAPNTESLFLLNCPPTNPKGGDHLSILAWYRTGNPSQLPIRPDSETLITRSPDFVVDWEKPHVFTLGDGNKVTLNGLRRGRKGEEAGMVRNSYVEFGCLTGSGEVLYTRREWECRVVYYCPVIE